jgi:hypothetical protein
VVMQPRVGAVVVGAAKFSGQLLSSAEHKVVGVHAPFGCGADAAGQISPVGQYENGLRSFFFLCKRTGHRFVYNNNPGEFRNT